MCNVQYYNTLIDFIGHYLKRDRHKYTEWGWKKNNMNLYLDIFSFTADIWPGSDYPSDEWNKLFSYYYYYWANTQ